MRRRYSKKIIDFMRKCAKSNISFKETLKKAKLEFEENFSQSIFYKHARKHGIHFVREVGGLDDIDKRRLKIIRKHKHLRIYEIRDIIIEELGSAEYKEPQLRKIRNKILIEEANKKGVVTESKFSEEVDGIIRNTYGILTLSELQSRIKKDTKKDYKILDLKERVGELNIT